MSINLRLESNAYKRMDAVKSAGKTFKMMIFLTEYEKSGDWITRTQTIGNWSENPKRKPFHPVTFPSNYRSELAVEIVIVWGNLFRPFVIISY